MEGFLRSLRLRARGADVQGTRGTDGPASLVGVPSSIPSFLIVAPWSRQDFLASHISHISSLLPPPPLVMGATSFTWTEGLRNLSCTAHVRFLEGNTRPPYLPFLDAWLFALPRDPQLRGLRVVDQGGLCIQE